MFHAFGEKTANRTTSSVDELKADYDRIAPHVVEGLAFIRDEILRR